MPTSTPEQVIDFWFGQPAADGSYASRPEWFRKDPAFDEALRERFGQDVEAALAGRLDGWQERGPRAALARIVLLDQLPRNLFRGLPRAFAGDARALAAAQSLVARGFDRLLPPQMRWFAYLPFEHAESRAAQGEGVRLYRLLAAAHPSLADALDWAIKHRDVIERFGRFPHRNEVLGRTSTAEEAEFLLQPGSRF